MKKAIWKIALRRYTVPFGMTGKVQESNSRQAVRLVTNTGKVTWQSTPNVVGKSLAQEGFATAMRGSAYAEKPRFCLVQDAGVECPGVLTQCPL